MASILGKPGGPGQFPTHDLSTVRGALHITVKKAPPPDWKEWDGKADKLQYFSPNPGAGD